LIVLPVMLALKLSSDAASGRHPLLDGPAWRAERVVRYRPIAAARCADWPSTNIVGV
jgi:hypothetical protein